MHNSFPQPFSTPIETMLLANTFSGRWVANLWVSKVQAALFYTAFGCSARAMWETLAAYTQRSSVIYTGVPTGLVGFSSDSKGQLSPQSTGPIKSNDKVHKENRS